MIGKYIRRNAELTEQIKSLTEENEQLRNQASHESMGSFQHNSSQSEFAEYSGTNLREAFTRNAEQFDSLMVAMLAENEQLKRKAELWDYYVELVKANGASSITDMCVQLQQIKANEQQLLENGRGYEERIRELQLEDYDKALMINVLKANEQRYIDALKTYAELEILENDGANCAQKALAQSPQQVEVYRTGQAVIDAVMKRQGIYIEFDKALADYQSTIDKADNGE